MLTWIKSSYKVLLLVSLTVFMFVGCGDDDNTVTISGQMTFPEQLTEETSEKPVPVANTAVAVTDLSNPDKVITAQATNSNGAFEVVLNETDAIIISSKVIAQYLVETSKMIERIN